jgi:alkaline phosphatase D
MDWVGYYQRVTPTRRRFLATSAALPLVGLLQGCRDKAGDSGVAATPTRDPEPDPLDTAGWDTAAFAWGVQVGDATTASAEVRVRTTHVELSLVVWRASGLVWEEERRIDGLEVVDGTMSLSLDSLEPDQPYTLVAWSADGSSHSLGARFRTAIAPGASRVLTFGASSCLADNQPWPSMSVAALERLDLFLLLGDTIYADRTGADGSEPATTLDGYRSKWGAALSTAGLRDLTASTSIIATWDDHEVDNNWTDDPSVLEDGQLETALLTFREALPQTTSTGGLGIYRSLVWGDVAEFFVLDCRSERVPADGLYLSQAQFDWLVAALSASTARFKVILNSVPLTDLDAMFGTISASDRWQGYPEQRSALIAALLAADVQGMLWVTGDMHFGMVATLDPPGGPADAWYEVMAGPTGSELNIAGTLYTEDAQFSVLLADWNFTRFSLDPGTGIAVVTFVGDDGATLAEKQLQL